MVYGSADPVANFLFLAIIDGHRQADCVFVLFFGPSIVSLLTVDAIRSAYSDHKRAKKRNILKQIFFVH